MKSSIMEQINADINKYGSLFKTMHPKLKMYNTYKMFDLYTCFKLIKISRNPRRRTACEWSSDLTMKVPVVTYLADEYDALLPLKP